jgi:hypothetical protein
MIWLRGFTMQLRASGLAAQSPSLAVMVSPGLHVLTILGPYCTRCHTGKNPPKGYTVHLKDGLAPVALFRLYDAWVNANGPSPRASGVREEEDAWDEVATEAAGGVQLRVEVRKAFRQWIEGFSQYIQDLVDKYNAALAVAATKAQPDGGEAAAVATAMALAAANAAQHSGSVAKRSGNATGAKRGASDGSAAPVKRHQSDAHGGASGNYSYSFGPDGTFIYSAGEDEPQLHAGAGGEGGAKPRSRARTGGGGGGATRNRASGSAPPRNRTGGVSGGGKGAAVQGGGAARKKQAAGDKGSGSDEDEGARVADKVGSKHQHSHHHHHHHQHSKARPQRAESPPVLVDDCVEGE